MPLINPGDSIQGAINANPNGTSFCLGTGTHSITASIVPKTGNIFTGQFGAIVDGTGWATGDATQAAFRGGGGITDVQIRNLKIQNMPQQGVYVSDSVTTNWITEYCEITACAHKGIGAGKGDIVRHNFLHHNSNGNYSAFGGHGALFENNEISYGGSEQKIVAAANVIFRNNWVHHNDNGIWYDTAHAGLLIEDNLCEDNGNDAIVVEACPGDVGTSTPSTNIVRNNACRRNGLHGIFVAISHYIEVYGNVLSANERGIGYFFDISLYVAGTTDMVQVNSHDNVITTSGAGGASAPWSAAFTYQGGGSPFIDPYLIPGTKGLVFDRNTYHVSNSGTGAYWRWGNVQKTWAQWQAIPQDVSGVVGP